VREIGRAEVLKMVTPLWAKSHVLAKNAARHLKLILDYASMAGLREGANPAAWSGELGTLFSTRGDSVRHQPAPTLDQLQRFCRYAQTSVSLSDKAALLTILTACRRNEIRFAAWSEIDLAECTLTIPPERRKDCRPEPFIVPLSRQAVSVCQNLRELFPASSLLFPGKNPPHPICDQMQRKALRAFLKAPVSIHGCRSTFRDWAAQNGKDEIAAEMCLMHAVGSLTQRAYFRSDILERRRRILQEWADYILT